MTTIVTRLGKGTQLSWAEADANFTNLNNDKLEIDTPALTNTLDLKVDKTSTTGAAVIPTGTTAERPSPAYEGHFRRNAELGQWEGYDGAQWAGIGGASGGGGNPFCYENDITVTSDYTITTDRNAMSAGPIIIADGVIITIPNGSTWSIV